MSTIRITSVAERNKEGDYTVKWEVSPDKEGNIDIYSSLSDSSFSESSPIITTNINDQYVLVTSQNPNIREYFILKTSGYTSGVVSNRIITMDNIINFRDFGGYFNSNNQQLKWGKLYRSGDLSKANLYDQERIRDLGIKTIIDFRPVGESKNRPYLVHPDIRKISIPIIAEFRDSLLFNLNNKHFNRSDAIRYVQDTYIDLIENYKSSYADMFDILIDDNNYPILITSTLGKDGVGLACFFILYALDVPEYVIIDDYLLSNNLIDARKIVSNAHEMPEYIQEAVTALLSSDKSYINYVIEHIEQSYGSVDKYMEKELRVSEGKKALLRKNLLYSPQK
ncbi:MAG: tyrosine-protein phosphatase [Dysgonamonadaceae bacterium]|jgi:protein-tyrosine phosphatase|nr:tyrosine-protein phosphatase [Dysgonamonadaceae bacterium]